MAVYRPSYRPTYRDAKTGKLKKGKLQQSAVWWYEFSFAGQRIRESSKQTGKTLALKAEENRLKSLKKAYAGEPTETPKERIRTVVSAVAALKKRYPTNHRPKSVCVVNERSAHLERLLGSLLMPDLTEERITDYMSDRKAEGVSNRTINLELSVLSQAIGRKFQFLWPNLRRLEERHDVGRALSQAEEQAIVTAAIANRSKFIGPVVRIALITGMRRDEIRLLRWSQIDFERKTFTVGEAKTAAGRGRVIPFGTILEGVLSGHLGWYASKLGIVKPEWYVFPRSNRTKPTDPTRPVTSIKKAWESVRKSAGVSCRFHDLRHTVCTKMAEAGIPEATMQAIMGHVSRAMLERYSHIRKASKIDAMQAVESRSFSGAVPKVSPKVEDLEAPKPVVTH
jgi:integrase